MSLCPLKVPVATLNDRWSYAIIQGLRMAGVDAIPLPVYQFTNVSHLQSALKQLEPFDFILFRSFHAVALHGNQHEVYDYIFTDCPYQKVVWYHDSQEFQDPPALQRLWKKYRSLPNSVIFSVEPDDLPKLKDWGNSTHYLPIAAADAILDHPLHPTWETLKSKFATSIAFTGSQIYRDPPFPESSDAYATAFENRLLEHLDGSLLLRKEWPLLRKIVHEIFSQSFTSGCEFKEFLAQSEKTLATRSAVTVPATTDGSQRASECLNTNAESDIDAWQEAYPQISSWVSWHALVKHLNYVRQQFDLRVFGDPSWRHFLPGYSDEPLSLSELELHALYAASKITLCFTKFHFSKGIHERPFLISASGGFALTEERETLHALFPEQEIATYRSQEELIDKIRFYLENDSERLAMAKRAQRRTLRHHLYSHRMREMLSILRQNHFIA